nr:MAG TPA: hypothetical protein [Caudoviricetes sp.]
MSFDTALIKPIVFSPASILIYIEPSVNNV